MAETISDTIESIALALVHAHGGESRITQLPGEDRWEVCAIQVQDDDAILCRGSRIVHSDGTDAYLTEGTRVRHRRHPELVGTVHGLERKRDGSVSAIPYSVAWDNDGRACDVLGWFYHWGTDHGLEVIDES